MAENKQRWPGVVGPAYTLRSERFDCQELINFYIENDELGAGKGGEPAVLMPTPGLEYLQTVGAGPNRGMYTVSNSDTMYIVSGEEVYYLTAPDADPVLLDGVLNTTIGSVRMIDNGIQLVIVDGQYGYYTTLGSMTLTQIVSDNFFPTQMISYQDGYFIGTQVGTQAFFLSDINAVTWPSLNQTLVQGSPDILVASVSSQRQLYQLGAHSTEIWWDAGNSASTPFERQDGRFSQQGCSSAYSVCQVNESLIWLGTNAQGGAMVFGLNNSLPGRISTFAVERTIQETNNAGLATAFTYQQEGHFFWCLNVPGLNYTWVYDLTSNSWHKRSSNVNGFETRSIAENTAVLNEQIMVGDYVNGNIYRYNLNVWTENGNVVYRTRQFPHLSNNLNRNFYNVLELDFQMGVGLPSTVQPSRGSQYTQYGMLRVDPRGAAGYIDKFTPIDIAMPQGELWYAFPDGDPQDSYTLLTDADFDHVVNVWVLGVGNALFSTTYQMPPVPVNTYLTGIGGESEAQYAFYFAIPMQMLDKVWVTSFEGVWDDDTGEHTFTIEIRVGNELQYGDRWLFTGDGHISTARRLQGTERLCT
jgi:hypothetical protein